MTKLSIFVSFIAVLIATSCSHEPRLINTLVLPEITNPHKIISDHEHIIISDGIEGTTIMVYSVKDLSLKSKFGGDGDVTGKFIVDGGHSVDMDIQNDTLLITSHWKASFFTKSGSLIRELPVDYDTYGYHYLGKQFTGSGFIKEDGTGYYTFNLYDSQFKFITEITRIEGRYHEEKGNRVLTREYQGLTYDDKFYFKGRSQDLEFEVFNADGSKRSVFSHPHEKVLVNEQHKNDIYAGYRDHPFFGQYFEEMKKGIIFPEYLPAMFNFEIADDCIYALAYQNEDNVSPIYKFDLQGKLIKQLNVPIQWKSSVEVFPYSISNGYLYQIVKTKEGNWSLQVIKL